jgi:hypothetical protein
MEDRGTPAEDRGVGQCPGRHAIGVMEMSVARTIASRVDELRLRQARAEAHRAMLDFLRADWFDRDIDRPAHRVALATARAEQIEAAIRGVRLPH